MGDEPAGIEASSTLSPADINTIHGGSSGSKRPRTLPMPGRGMIRGGYRRTRSVRKGRKTGRKVRKTGRKVRKSRKSRKSRR